jgi:Domain of unknown function (DUF697)
MNRTIRVVALFGSATILLSFLLLVVSETAQVTHLASTIHPTLGTVTLVALLGTYTTLLGVPAFLILRLPSPLTPPASEFDPEFPEHLKKLSARLEASPLLKGRDLSHQQAVEDSLVILARRTDEIVRHTATTVFLSTAVSQSGRLDGLLVLAAQSRMVWKIAHIYYQRPTARDMVHLYANVATTAFLAGELQEIDLGEQVEPVIAAAMGALGASVPGLQVAGSILTNCVLDGSANAFLTLRVGMITKRYCGALVLAPKSAVRRAATTEAASLLGAIVAEGSGRITKAILKSAGDKIGGAVVGASSRARDAGAKLFARVRPGRFRDQPGTP